MMGNVERRWPICNSFSMNCQTIVASDRVGHRNVDGTRITFLAVPAPIAQTQRTASVGNIHRSRSPDLLVKALHTSMEMIGSLVSGQFVSFFIQSEPGSGNPPRDASYDRAEVRMTG